MTVFLTNNGWTGDTTGTWTNGNDVVSNTTNDPYGIQVEGGVTANTLDGNDSITGNGYIGIHTYYGAIDTGNGDDSLTGVGLGGGISNVYGTIDTGNGNDSLIGISNALNGGIYNHFSSTIETGEGADFIAGADIGARGRGIVNYGTIDTGSGCDLLISGGEYYSNVIENYGTIDTGAYDDMVIATGGFLGNGSVFLGLGDDILCGFGSGHFDGGSGIDVLMLPNLSLGESYGVTRSGDRVTFSFGGNMMDTTGFEVLTFANSNSVFDIASLADNSFISFVV
jgi:hypothetical protein